MDNDFNTDPCKILILIFMSGNWLNVPGYKTQITLHTLLGELRLPFEKLLIIAHYHVPYES